MSFEKLIACILILLSGHVLANDNLQYAKEKLPPHIPCPKFVAAKYPELAVIYGCYYYALDNFATKTAKI